MIGIIPADVMRNRVGDYDVLEGTIEDLIVIGWVTPGPKTVIS